MRDKGQVRDKVQETRDKVGRRSGLRLGLGYVSSLRGEAAERIVRERRRGRYRSVEDFVRRTRLNKAELDTLAELGALNSLGRGLHRREALWQIEKAYRPKGPLFEMQETEAPEVGPLAPMTPFERLDADYRGSGMTTGPHPMHYMREALAGYGAVAARDLEKYPNGMRICVAGAVITRQRPGTAKGFCFLTLEDETGVSNLILAPQVFQDYRAVVMNESFVAAEGFLQKVDGTISIKTDWLEPVRRMSVRGISHDFH